MNILQRIVEGVRVDEIELRHMPPRAEKEEWIAAATPQIAPILYRRYFLGLSEPVSSLGALREEKDALYAETLHQANRGTGYIDWGWEYGGAVDGRHRVTRDGVTLTAAESEVVFAAGAAGVRFPNARRNASRGHYTAIGNAGPPSVKRPMLRVYANVSAEAAPALLAAVTALLCAEAVPYQVKVLDDRGAFGRPDAMVVYLERKDSRLLAQLGALFCAHDLIDAVPGFTRRWLRGVALAENPPAAAAASQSFGQHRSLCVARGLAAAELAASPYDQRIPFIRQAMREGGIDPDRPHLNAGSDEIDVERGVA